MVSFAFVKCVVANIVVAYAVFLAFFQCPADALALAACPALLSVRHSVELHPVFTDKVVPLYAKHVQPLVDEHVEPFYAKHVQPIIELHVKPAVEQHVQPFVADTVVPGLTAAKDKAAELYGEYAQPYVLQAAEAVGVPKEYHGYVTVPHKSTFRHVVEDVEDVLAAEAVNVAAAAAAGHIQA